MCRVQPEMQKTFVALNHPWQHGMTGLMNGEQLSLVFVRVLREASAHKHQRCFAPMSETSLHDQSCALTQTHACKKNEASIQEKCQLSSPAFLSCR